MWFRTELSALSVLAVASAISVRAEVKVGDPFPALAPAGVVSLSAGEVPTVGSGQVMLIDFWASWCAPCKASFPAMGKLQTEYANRGFSIAAISIDEKSAAAAAFVKKMAPPFPTLHDPAQKLVAQVGVPTMPTSYLVGRDGRVRFIHAGFHDDTDKVLRREIESLLDEKS